MSPSPKVTIAVPCLDFVASDFAFSLAALLGKRAYDRKLSRDVPVGLIHQSGSIIMDARNALLTRAIESGATHILFLDSDITFPPDTLDRLLSHHVPVVGASYVKRVPPHSLLGVRDNTRLAAGSLTPMQSLPFGCILLDLSIFSSIPRPWFRYITTAEGSQSEDTYCCALLRQHGHTIFCDTALTREIGHVGVQAFRPT